jgi:CheY-like chemotaxis protein
MKFASSYILLLVHQSEDFHGLESLLERLRCPVEIVSSPNQAVDRIRQNPPCLVIVQGNHSNWSQSFVRQLRTIADADNITLVALSDSHAPSWLHQEENPGFDGFLVKPLSFDVLFSLIQSASARQLCRSSV